MLNSYQKHLLESDDIKQILKLGYFTVNKYDRLVRRKYIPIETVVMFDGVIIPLEQEISHQLFIDDIGIREYELEIDVCIDSVIVNDIYCHPNIFIDSKKFCTTMMSKKKKLNVDLIYQLECSMGSCDLTERHPNFHSGRITRYIDKHRVIEGGFYEQLRHSKYNLR